MSFDCVGYLLRIHLRQPRVRRGNNVQRGMKNIRSDVERRSTSTQRDERLTPPHTSKYTRDFPAARRIATIRSALTPPVWPKAHRRFPSIRLRIDPPTVIRARRFATDSIQLRSKLRAMGN